MLHLDVGSRALAGNEKWFLAYTLPKSELKDLGRDRWLSVRSTVGVSNLLTTQDGRPIPVPAGIVEALIEQCDGNMTRLDTRLVKGQHVRILSGPFADFVGTLERLDATERVQVLLEMMGTSVPVTLHRSVLSPAA
jgi:transcription antitermination factor NusG